MMPLFRLTLSILRFATHGAFFLEAQRLLLRLLRPTRKDHVRRLESEVLRTVRTPLLHRWVRDASGNLIHVLETSAAARDAPTAVLLHGHSMSAAFWFRNIDDLASLGFRVFAVDLLGWGRSHRPCFRGRTPEHAVDFFLSSFSSILPQLIPSRRACTLVGHSLGAYLALEFTRRNPAAVSRLIAVSPAATVRNVPFSRAVYFSLPPQTIVRRGGLLGFLLFVAKYPRGTEYTQSRLRDFTYHLATQQPPSGETAIRPIIRFTGPRSAECSRPLVETLTRDTVNSVPTLIVAGAQDSSMPVEGVHALFTHMKHTGYCVDMHVVPDSDHCPMLERPAVFAALMRAFCKADVLPNVLPSPASCFKPAITTL